MNSDEEADTVVMPGAHRIPRRPVPILVGKPLAPRGPETPQAMASMASIESLWRRHGVDYVERRHRAAVLSAAGTPGGVSVAQGDPVLPSPAPYGMPKVYPVVGWSGKDRGQFYAIAARLAGEPVTRLKPSPRAMLVGRAFVRDLWRAWAWISTAEPDLGGPRGLGMFPTLGDCAWQLEKIVTALDVWCTSRNVPRTPPVVWP